MEKLLLYKQTYIHDLTPSPEIWGEDRASVKTGPKIKNHYAKNKTTKQKKINCCR